MTDNVKAHWELENAVRRVLTAAGFVEASGEYGAIDAPRDRSGFEIDLDAGLDYTDDWNPEQLYIVVAFRGIDVHGRHIRAYAGVLRAAGYAVDCCDDDDTVKVAPPRA